MEEEKISQILKTHINEPLTFEEYTSFFEQLVKEGKTNWPEQTKEMIDYTKLNFSRSKRNLKQFSPSEAWKKIKLEPETITAYTLTEPWCGDAAQNLPILHIILLELNINHILLLRDKNDDLMNEVLTNGGKAIPKTIFVDSESLLPLFTWGPRPADAQAMVEEYKAAPEPKKAYMEFAEDLHNWYNQNQGKSLENELLELFETFSDDELE
ncbi:MAG: thioredoxin family protein [Luteibaculaceae bacterium]